MHILNKIVASKQREVMKIKESVPVSQLEKSSHFTTPVRSLRKSILDRAKYGIIAEFKRQSPSRGIINSLACPAEVCKEYIEAGASAVSVLTNTEFFGGRNSDLVSVRESCGGPVLRKDFIIDEYQVVESKSIGADAILLIVDILSKNELRKLSSLGSSLGLEMLFEIHDKEGIDKLPPDAILVGINSRNLHSFSINMELPLNIIKKLPEESIKIAESGIHSVQDLLDFRDAGFDGFLIGEMFMKNAGPGASCKRFIQKINALRKQV